jgi:hypothetical protein
MGEYSWLEECSASQDSQSATYSSPTFLTLLMDLSRVSLSLYGRVCRRSSVLSVGSLSVLGVMLGRRVFHGR